MVGDAIDEVDVLAEAKILVWWGRKVPRWIGVGTDISEAEGANDALGPMDVGRARRWRGEAAAPMGDRGRRGGGGGGRGSGARRGRGGRRGEVRRRGERRRRGGVEEGRELGPLGRRWSGGREGGTEAVVGGHALAAVGEGAHRRRQKP